MKHADACCGTPGTPMLNHTGLLNAARWVTRMYFSSAVNASASVVVGEVAALGAPRGDRVGDPVDDLAQRRLALGVPSVPRKYFWATMLRGVQRPGDRELDAGLLEGDRAVLPVGDPGVAPLPHHLVVGIDTRRREEPAEADAGRSGASDRNLFNLRRVGSDEAMRGTRRRSLIWWSPSRIARAAASCGRSPDRSPTKRRSMKPAVPAPPGPRPSSPMLIGHPDARRGITGPGPKRPKPPIPAGSIPCTAPPSVSD